MTWSGFLFGAIGAFLVWLLTEFVGRPFRRFFDLRSEVSRRLVQFDNVFARAKMVDATRRETIELSPTEDARLTAAQDAFRDLASQMRAFSQAEWLAELIVRHVFKFDAFEVSKALIGYSNEISTYGQMRADFKSRIQTLLRIRAAD
jgi:hypothetical protein